MNSMQIEKLENGVFRVQFQDRLYTVCNEQVTDLEGLPPPPASICHLLLSTVNNFVSLGQYTTWF